MNEYGKRVAKKMEDYMGDPNSVSKEINDIQNAIEGVEVRGALAAGVAKSFNKSKNAEEKAEEAHEITQDLLDETFDSAALEANFEQRLNDEIANLQPEWTQFKNDTVSQLAETVSGVINVRKMFGHIEDDSDAIQAALDIGGEIVLDGTKPYRITKPLVFKKDHTYLVGSGLPQLVWEGEVGGTMVIVDRSISGKVFEDIQIKNIYFNGNGKTKWIFDFDGFSYNCYVDNVHMSRSVGSIYADNCFYSTWHKVYVWSQFDGLPDGMSVSDWEEVHNRRGSAPIAFKKAHSARISNFHVGSIGTSQQKIPAGKRNTERAMLVEGYSTTLTDLSFEGTRGKDAKEVALDSVITLDYGTNITINNIYMEAIHSRSVFQLREYILGQVTINGVYYEKSSFSDYFLDSYYIKNKVELHNITGVEVDLPSNGRLARVPATQPFETSGIHFREGKPIEYNGKLYDNPKVGAKGITGARLYVVGNLKVPSVRSGLDVTYSGNKIYVDPGTIQNIFGELVYIGQASLTRKATDDYTIGKSFHMNEGGEWNLCVDREGMVYIEDVNSPRNDVDRGKMILATFNTDPSGLITSLVKYNNFSSSELGGLITTLYGKQQVVSPNTATAIEFNKLEYGNREIYKTNEPTRLYVPNGVTRVRLSANLTIINLSANGYLKITKNGSNFYGMPNVILEDTGSFYANITTPIINVEAGDYFEVVFEHTKASDVVIGGEHAERAMSTWFSMEVFR